MNVITEYAAKSNFIEDFDLSWNRAPRTVWTHFFETFRDNKKIRQLSLVGNLIVHVTNKKGKLEITAAGQRTMDNLVYFMKKNTALQHLDFTSCGLLRPQLEQIAGAVVKCGSLVGLHLCLNPGVD